ncbi:hypothetical protein R5R35_005339 [Gryllus longicercus]|uniref:CHHC U11-48K-type domain-containing protein n=1 Tax=Gryllus longicercus TaxID=2509291 RepID=A0AAN9Z3K5_9ORTH
MADYNTFKKSAIRGQDEIVTCPYDPSHQVLKSRLQYHIVNCEKQHAQMEFETCPFNATHRFPKPEIQMHIFECPDRRILETHKFQLQDESHMSRNNLSEFIRPSLPPSEENWDEEEYQSSYDPSQHINNKCVLRNIQGATKSQRKQFRLEERRRLNQLSTGNSEPEVSNPGHVRLRPPKSLPKGINNLELGARLGMGRGSVPSTSAHDAGKSQSVGKVSGDKPL